jgi:hypothetical protein
MAFLMMVLLLLTGCACIGGGSDAGETGMGEQAEPEQEWIEVFADQEWSDFMAAEVSTFSGILRRVPDDPSPSFVMRFNPYKLELSSSDAETGSVRFDEGGELRDIYCGSSDELRPFIGARVEIQGWLNTMAVEGQLFVEIWPVRIREI